MPRNLLPRLRQAPNPANVPLAKVAEWTEVSTPADLAKLDFGVAPADDVRTRVQSIPSPWARLLLFRAALDDPGHPARRLVENELLDAFQFLWSRNERPGVTPTVTTLQVDDVEALAQRAGTQRAEWFGRALRELMPRRDGTGADAGGATPAFRALSIVSVNGRPVLGTSPYTVLFTAEDAAELPVGETGAFFRYAAPGPARGEARDLAQRPFAFQRYLAQVLVPQLEQLGSAATDNTDGAAVQRLLKRWLGEQVAACRRAQAGAIERQAQLDAPEGGAWKAAAAQLGLDEIGELTGAVKLYARRAGVEMLESPWLLRPERAIDGQAPIVVDPARFDGRYVPGGSAVSLPAALGTRDRSVLPGTATSYPWVSPADDWFTDEILVLAAPLCAGRPTSAAGGDAGGVYGFAHYKTQYGGNEEYLRRPQTTLPLTHEILRYFSPEEIERRLTIEVQPTGHIVVALKLPVGAEGSDFVVQRRYGATEIRRARGPELALWPSFTSEHWRDYLLFQRDPDGQTIQALKVQASRRGEPIDATSERRGDAAFVTQLDGAPEAIEFTDALSGGGTPRRLGLVLPRYTEVAATTSQQWTIGVDFGTSNTVVTRRIEGSPAADVLSVQHLTLALTQPTPGAERLAEAYFFPTHLDGEPFGTAMVRQRSLPSFALDQEPLGLRLNIPLTGRPVQDRLSMVVGDLKWSGEREPSFMAAAYLRHVMALVLAEAVRAGVDPTQVTLVWSYPRAFTVTQRDQMVSLWTRVLQHFAAQFGSGAKQAPNTSLLVKMQSMDESGAVLRHFFNAGQATGAGEVNVILDVGGGTSDIAMYGGGRTLALDSVMLGGRNLTGNRAQAGTAGQLGNQFVARVVQWCRQHASAKPEHQADRDAVEVYQRDGQDHLAFGYLVRSSWFNEQRPEFSASAAAHAFQGMVLYFFGALFYYVGLSLRGIAAQDGATPVRLPAVIILAGNGSRYIDWLTNMLDARGAGAATFGPFAQVLSRVLAAGAHADPQARPPEIRLSQEPKREVALGLVGKVNLSGLAELDGTQLSVVGEAVRVEVGERREPTAFAATTRMSAGASIPAGAVSSLVWTGDAMEIERFHAAFREAIGPLVSYGAQWGELNRRFGALFDAMQGPALQQATRTRLEYLANAHNGFQGSVFVLESSAVLGRMLDEWFEDVPRYPTPAMSRTSIAR